MISMQNLIAQHKSELLRMFDSNLEDLRNQAAQTLDRLYEAAVKQIEADQKLLLQEKKKKRQDEVQRKVIADQTKNTKIIKLDVGGIKYITTWETLCKPGSYFEAMFSGRHELIMAQEGFYFLDRNGKVFEGVLDYLRTGIISPPAGVTLEQLENELDYFLLLDEKEVARKKARKTPELSELCIGRSVWIKEKPATLYNYAKAAKDRFGREATISDLYFSGNALCQVGLTFSDNFTYYFSCKDLEIEVDDEEEEDAEDDEDAVATV